MPNTWYGYEFTPEEWQQARWGGLEGGLAGMQGASTWAETWMGLGTGMAKGMDASLATSLKTRQAREEQAAAEELAARKDAAAREQILFYKNRIPDELEEGMGSDSMFATPQEAAEHWRGQSELFEKKQTEDAQYEVIKEALDRAGIPSTGDPKQDADRLKKWGEVSVQAQAPMNEYQRESLKLRQDEAARAEAERAEADAEAEQEELGNFRIANRIYYSLPEAQRRSLPSPQDFSGTTEQLLDLYDKAVQQGPSMSEEKKQEILGDAYTGEPDVDNPIARRILEYEVDEGMAGEDVGDGEEIDPFTQSMNTLKKYTKAIPSQAPGMPVAGAPKKDQPKEAIPTNAGPSKVAHNENPAHLTDQGLQNVLTSIGVSLVDARSFLANPQLSLTFRQKWASAKTPAARAEVRAELQAKLSRLTDAQGNPLIRR